MQECPSELAEPKGKDKLNQNQITKRNKTETKHPSTTLSQWTHCTVTKSSYIHVRSKKAVRWELGFADINFVSFHIALLHLPPTPSHDNGAPGSDGCIAVAPAILMLHWEASRSCKNDRIALRIPSHTRRMHRRIDCWKVGDSSDTQQVVSALASCPEA